MLISDELIHGRRQAREGTPQRAKAEQAHESLQCVILNGCSYGKSKQPFQCSPDLVSILLGRSWQKDKMPDMWVDVPEFARAIRERIQSEQCPVCGSPMDEYEAHRAEAKRDHSQALAQVEQLEIQVAASKRHKDEEEKDMISSSARLQS